MKQHAGPDQAIDDILHAFAKAQQATPRADARHRIEHCQTIRDDQLERMKTLGVTPSFFALAFSPDGQKIVSAGLDRSVNVHDTTTGERFFTLTHTGNVLCVAFSPDGRRLASAGEDKTVRVWDASTGREVLGLRGHTEACTCLAFSPDPEVRRLVSASADGTIRIWDATPLRGNEGQESHPSGRSARTSPQRSGSQIPQVHDRGQRTACACTRVAST